MIYQTQLNKPLFEQFLWAQPERIIKDQPLLIMGGNAQSLQAPLLAFTQADKQQLPVKMILPDIFKKMKIQGEIAFCPSTRTGSFSQTGLEALLNLTNQHLYLLIAGDLSANQETQQLISKLISRSTNTSIVTGDIIESLAQQSQLMNTKLILIFNQPQSKNLFKRWKIYQQTMTENDLAQVLKDLDIDSPLILHHDHALWIKYRQAICKNPVNPNFTNYLSLAIDLVRYLQNNPNQLWESLVTATWHSNPNAI